MTKMEYTETKLQILESANDGAITESQRDELLELLEAKNAASDLTPEQIDEFFSNLTGKYPDLEDDIEKLKKKIDKASGSDSDDSDDEGSEVSEAALELFELIENM